jgi:hypothetical protein
MDVAAHLQDAAGLHLHDEEHHRLLKFNHHHHLEAGGPHLLLLPLEELPHHQVREQPLLWSVTKSWRIFLSAGCTLILVDKILAK